MDLEQLRYLENEIKILTEQIERLNKQVVTDVVTGSSKYYPFTEHNVYIEGVPVCNKAIKLKAKLALRLEELLITQNEMVDYVNSINDCELRLILTLRLIENLTWDEVARKMNYADESAPRKRYARFILDHNNDRKIRNKVC